MWIFSLLNIFCILVGIGEKFNFSKKKIKGHNSKYRDILCILPFFSRDLCPYKEKNWSETPQSVISGVGVESCPMVQHEHIRHG